MKEKFNKNNGTVSIPVTKEKIIQEKENKIRNSTLESMQKVINSQKDKFTKDEHRLIEKAFELNELGNLDSDPVLKEFVTQRNNLNDVYKKKQAKCKEMQLDFLQKLNAVTDDAVACKNNLDFLDQMILDKMQKNLQFLKK